MAWLRLTMAAPHPGQAGEVKQLLDSLENVLAAKPGYLMGGVFTSAQGTGEMGRFSLWRTGEDADRASSDQEVLAMRSQINALVAAHSEHLHEISGASHNIPS